MQAWAFAAELLVCELAVHTPGSVPHYLCHGLLDILLILVNSQT